MALFGRQRGQDKKSAGLVSPQEVHSIVKGSMVPGEWNLQRRHFQFVLINVLENETADSTATTINNVISMIGDHGAAISSAGAVLIVGVLGIPTPSLDSPDARRKLVDALGNEFGKLIRIAHGECEGLVGSFGVGVRSTYDWLIPGFTAIVQRLLSGELGSAIEIPESSRPQITRGE